jgi:hypothetical protein
MFVRNNTTERITLARGQIGEDEAAAALLVETVYRVHSDGIERTSDPPLRGAAYPPDRTSVVLWAEVSVTASGTTFGPSAPPHVCPVSLSVGPETWRLIVFGPRRWQRTITGDLEPSKPAPFDAISIGWDRAFGGAYDIPPGLDPASGLPHPGGRMLHRFNPHGRGLYPDKRAAADQPMAEVERPDQLIKNWSDQPAPAGLSPCPELHGMRIPARRGGLGRDVTGGADLADLAATVSGNALLMALRMHHHAPGDLVLPVVEAGTALALIGLGAEPLRCSLPGSPVRVRTRRRRDEAEVRPRLRSVHLDGDQRTVTAVYGHSFRYDPEKPPTWIIVDPTP